NVVIAVRRHQDLTATRHHLSDRVSSNTVSSCQSARRCLQRDREEQVFIPTSTAAHAGRGRSLRDPHPVAEQGHFLRVDRRHEVQGTLWYFAELGSRSWAWIFPV